MLTPLTMRHRPAIGRPRKFEAVRLCGLVCPAAELNAILVAKGFPNTQVVPVANPNRFFLGRTTPRETHDLVDELAAATGVVAARGGVPYTPSNGG